MPPQPRPSRPSSQSASQGRGPGSRHRDASSSEDGPRDSRTGRRPSPERPSTKRPSTDRSAADYARGDAGSRTERGSGGRSPRGRNEQRAPDQRIPAPRSPERRPGHELRRRLSLYAPEVLRPRSLTQETIPVLIARSPTRQPAVFRKMIKPGPKEAQPGDLVHVTLEDGSSLGYGLYNPRAEMMVRLLTRNHGIPDEHWWERKLAAAYHYRHEMLKVHKVTDAYRLIHAEADGLPGLVVDRYGDTLSVEAFSLGMYQRVEAMLDILTRLTGAKHAILRTGPHTAEAEGFDAEPFGSEDSPEETTVQEYGVQFCIDFCEGHKTGFFCDQRENRHEVAGLAKGRPMLDVCCYTGGFAIHAAKAGAESVTAVDLDETAIAMAKQNARLNGQQIAWTHADAFTWMREAATLGKTWDVVVLDPPKLIRTRDDFEEGRRRYFDLNRLAASLVAPGGLLVTCSCSGLMSSADFLKLTCQAVDTTRRTARLFRQTGAGPDHPVAASYPESSYLKANWFRFAEE